MVPLGYSTVSLQSVSPGHPCGDFPQLFCRTLHKRGSSDFQRTRETLCTAGLHLQSVTGELCQVKGKNSKNSGPTSRID